MQHPIYFKINHLERKFIMTTQSDFFNPEHNNQAPLNDPVPSGQKRVFVYDGQYWDDPGPAYTPNDVRLLLAKTYPALENGAWTSRILPDGVEEITFVKTMGEKGASARQVTDTLLSAPPAFEIGRITRTLADLEQGGPLPAAELAALAPRIESALYEAERLSQQSRKMTLRCLQLKPIPASTLPLGF
jgi:PRTRC genetic system protein C